jgi:hypothetical protein
VIVAAGASVDGLSGSGVLYVSSSMARALSSFGAAVRFRVVAAGAFTGSLLAG